jgi:uncharacterized membrane protein
VSGWVIVVGLVLALVAASFSPIIGVAVVLVLVVLAVADRGRPRSEAPKESELARRVAALETAVDSLQNDLNELRWPGSAPPPASTTSEPEPEPEPVAAAVLQAPPPPPPPPPPPRKPREPRWWEGEIAYSDLLGARALAIAGGIVTLLGIVLVFVLAVNRGWISPELRLGFGGLASAAAFAAGFWIRRRYGQLYSALAAVGAGLAGGFATLVAATALYEFVPEIWALAAAAGIAAVGVTVALSWSSQLVGGLGLVGALLMPLLAVIEEDEVSFVGTGFTAIVLAGALLVGIERRWRELLLVSAGVAIPQIAGLVWQAEATDWGVVVLAGLFSLLILSAGVATQLRLAVRSLEPLAATFLLAGATVAGYSAAWLFAGTAHGVDREGAALLVVAAVHGLAGALLFRRERELSALLLAIGLTIAAVAAGELLSGVRLTIAWAGEAAILAWLAERTRERRFQLAAVAYLALAFGYALVVEAPPKNLFEVNDHPASGGLSLLAVAIAAVALAWFTRAVWERPKREGPVARSLGDLVALVRRVSAGYAWLGGAVLVYAASLALLELFAWMEYGALATRFERGHVALAGFWAGLALVLVEAGMRRRGVRIELGGLALLALAVLEVLAFDATELDEGRYPISLLLVAGGALLSAFEYQRLGRWAGLRLEAAVAQLVSLALAVGGVVDLAHGSWHGVDVEGGALLLVAVVYGAFAALCFRSERNFSSLLWATALVVGGLAAGELLTGVWFVLAWAVAAAVLAWLAHALRELRFQAASFAFLLVGLGYALVYETPPRDLLVSAKHPAEGVPSLALVVLVALAAAWFSRHETPDAEPLAADEPLTVARLSGVLATQQRLYRLWGIAGAAVLALYGLSLTVLEIFEAVSRASVETDFQRGHTAVSAFWGLVGLGLLTLGLVRRLRALRLAGFALFGVSLAKLFLYDLTFLSSLARALSFLAVGAFLLLGGFFYQRLSGQLGERDRSAGGGAPA